MLLNSLGDDGVTAVNYQVIRHYRHWMQNKADRRVKLVPSITINTNAINKIELHAMRGTAAVQPRFFFYSSKPAFVLLYLYIKHLYSYICILMYNTRGLKHRIRQNGNTEKRPHIPGRRSSSFQGTRIL